MGLIARATLPANEDLTRSNLPDPADARFPALYDAAILALRSCASVDECREWQSKAEAIASYARQANDDTLLNTALRIKARAARRVGEMYREVPRAPMGAAAHVSNSGGDPPELETRGMIADRVGMSPRQVKQSLQIAAVPLAVFEGAIEADTPATLIELAKLGVKPRAPAPATKPDPWEGIPQSDRNAATFGFGAISYLLEYGGKYPIDAMMRGAIWWQVDKALDHAESAIVWLERVRAALLVRKTEIGR